MTDGSIDVLWLLCLQAFINTAAKIYQKIEEGIFDVSNEVSPTTG